MSLDALLDALATDDRCEATEALLAALLVASGRWTHEGVSDGVVTCRLVRTEASAAVRGQVFELDDGQAHQRFWITLAREGDGIRWHLLYGAPTEGHRQRKSIANVEAFDSPDALDWTFSARGTAALRGTELVDIVVDPDDPDPLSATDAG